MITSLKVFKSERVEKSEKDPTEKILQFWRHRLATARVDRSRSLSLSVCFLSIYIQIYSRVQAAWIGAGFKVTGKRRRRLLSPEGRTRASSTWMEPIGRSLASRVAATFHIRMLSLIMPSVNNHMRHARTRPASQAFGNANKLLRKKSWRQKYLPSDDGYTWEHSADRKPSFFCPIQH